MSGNIKFRWSVIAFLLFTLFCSSCASMLESAGQRIKQRDLKSKILKNPNDYDANYGLGVAYVKKGERFSIPSTNWKKVFFQSAIRYLEEAIRIRILLLGRFLETRRSMMVLVQLNIPLLLKNCSKDKIMSKG